MAPPTFRVGFLTSNNVDQEILHRHAQEFVSMVILNLAKLTAEIASALNGFFSFELS